MKLVTKQEILQRPRGVMALIYSETGDGKTVSTLQSIADPLLYIQPEPRELQRALDAAQRPDLDFDVAEYDNFEDTLEFLSTADLSKYRSIFVDSLSHLMNIQLSTEIQMEAFDAREEKEKKKKRLASMAKMSEEAWGALASQMFRLCQLLMKQAQQGKLVICSALLDSAPKWNRELTAAPAFGGKMFNRNYSGFFDLIGLVRPRFNDAKEVLYPPIVYFKSDDDSFVAKPTGLMAKTYGPLNWSKILGQL